jgi:hypothetical protein
VISAVNLSSDARSEVQIRSWWLRIAESPVRQSKLIIQLMKSVFKMPGKSKESSIVIGAVRKRNVHVVQRGAVRLLFKKKKAQIARCPTQRDGGICSWKISTEVQNALSKVQYNNLC